MKLREVCRAINKHENYLAVIKKTSPDKFNYMMSLDKNQISAYYKYIDEQQDVILRLNHIFYKKSEEKGEMEKLYRYLSAIKLFSSPESAKISFSGTLMRYSTREMKHKTFLKYKELAELLEELK